MTKVQECLAQNMKHYRKERRFTQEQLAEKIGTSTNYIGVIEIGSKFPSPKMIEKIAEALEIPSPKLFEDRESISEQKSLQKANLDIKKFRESLISDVTRVLDKNLEYFDEFESR